MALNNVQMCQVYKDHALEALYKFSDIREQKLHEDIREQLSSFFTAKPIKDLLVYVSKYDPFTNEAHETYANNIDLLSALKHLKYFYNLPVSQVLDGFTVFYVCKPVIAAWLMSLRNSVSNDEFLSKKKTYELFEELSITDYDSHVEEMEKVDPHCVYPTNIYRRGAGHVVYSKDYTTFESTMTLTLTSTTKIRRNVLEVSEPTLSSIYKPLGRCLAIVDDKVDSIYGLDIKNYFDAHDVKLTKMVYSGNEVDKNIKNVEKILIDLKQSGVARNEPVLIVGGGVIADIGGFACALYHRSTPYVMLCTSVVTGIDAGPSPRKCCDAFGFKNLYGAYHPPVMTITDRFFFKTLPHGWLRHGIAEIIKMASVKDKTLFELLEIAGRKLITTKFGTDDSIETFDGDFEDLCDRIIGRALAGYIETEHKNIWETHQCRPHAFGHTWSPGYELPAGMLHGHAAATEMGYGAYLSLTKKWINNETFHRLLKLMSCMELSLWHPIMSDIDMLYTGQKKVTAKRGGRLCAPVPKEYLGNWGYINDVSYSFLGKTLLEYKEVCEQYPRNGLGVDVHCKDVGVDDPSVDATEHVRNEMKLDQARN